MERIIEFMTVKEVREGIKKMKTIILPVGVIEQHGYHLPLNTDVYNCYELAKRASAKTGCFVAPPVIYSYSGGELPGTIDITPQTTSLVIMDILESLANQGFKNIIILLGHGGTENQIAVKDAVDMFLRRKRYFKDIKVAFMPFTSLSTSLRRIFKDKDFHAGYLETSLMLYWQPKLVRNKYVTDTKELMALFRKDQDAYQVKEKPIDNKFVFPRIRQNPKIKVGVMGRPEKSNAQYGKVVAEECVKSIVRLIKEME
ncbi:MAG: creatininase family protein [Candidatus Omnitrophica bacterium]|nr:creatininase family protein [Candidatus Omnitrophota bacterium]